MNLAFIPARGGSKGIHLKNVRNLCGVPLLQHSLYTLEKSEVIDLIVVATDSYEIRECAKAFGSTKLWIYERDEENAQDTSSTEDVMYEFFDKYSFDDAYVYLVQVTNPFLREEHIQRADEAIQSHRSVVTVTRDHRFLWNEEGQSLNYSPTTRPRRQDWEGILIENGAMYVTKVDDLYTYHSRCPGPVYPLIMEEKYSQLEIDELDDLIAIEHILRRVDGPRLAKVVERSRSFYKD
jgi:CMP-N-acetylneuraminic acid synthetase